MLNDNYEKINKALNLIKSNGDQGLIEASKILISVKLDNVALSYFKSYTDVVVDSIESPADKILFIGRYSKLLTYFTV